MLEYLNDEDFLEFEREYCSRSLSNFIQRGWHVLEPSQPYVHGWHIDALGEHLEAITYGQITRLLVNIPPGTMKSMCTAVFWPSWEWGPKHMANMRFIGASHKEEGVATRDNMNMRRLVASEWYQRLWPVQLVGDQNAKTHFQNTKTGWRQSCAVTSMTGLRGDRVLWDDPHSVEDAHSIVKLESANRVFRETLPTRLNNPDKSAIIIVMQRLNQKDISGEIINGGLGYDHLCLPMEYEAPRKATSIGFVDPRKKEGELLFPGRFSKEVVERDKIIMGEYAVAGQFQQRPSPAGGGILRPEKFRLWPGDKNYPDFEFLLQSYDTAFTEKTSGDPTACSVWGLFHYEKRMNVMLLDYWAERLSYPKLREKVMSDWQAEYGGIKDDQKHQPRSADVIIVEEKGSGQSLLQDLRLANVPVFAYNPGRADKQSRAHQAANLLESGNWWIMESNLSSRKGKPMKWAQELMTEMEQFPNGEHDDGVDSFTQTAIYLRDTRWLEVKSVPNEPSERDKYSDYEKRPRVNPYDQ